MLKRLFYTFALMTVGLSLAGCGQNGTGEPKVQAADSESTLAQDDENESTLAGANHHITKQFRKLSAEVQTYIKEHKDLAEKFAGNPTFSGRVVSANGVVESFNGKDVKWLAEHPDAFVLNFGPKHERKDGKILIRTGERYQSVSENFYRNGLNENEKEILSGLKKIGNEFYLKKDGSLVRADELSDIGYAKSWATSSPQKDLKAVSQKIKANADNRIKVINDLLPLTKEYGEIHSLLSRSKEMYQSIQKNGITTEREYAQYYGLASELFIYEDVLNQPLPIEFQDPINQKVVSKLENN